MVNFYLEGQCDVKESRAGKGNLQILKEASHHPSSEKMDFLLLVPLLLQSSDCYEKSNLIWASFQGAVIQDIRQPCKCKKMFFLGGKWHCGEKMTSFPSHNRSPHPLLRYYCPLQFTILPWRRKGALCRSVDFSFFFFFYKFLVVLFCFVLYHGTADYLILIGWNWRCGLTLYYIYLVSA